MYESVFGNVVAEKCLLYIVNYGEAHTRGISNTFGFYPTQVKMQLDKLELGGILVSQFIGNIRRFTLNPRLGIRKELVDLLEKILSLTDEETTQLYYRQRRRPVYATHRRIHRKTIFERDQGVCSLCMASEGKWEMDHIKALGEGGTDSLGNIRTLCVPCHKEQTKLLLARLRSYC